MLNFRKGENGHAGEIVREPDRSALRKLNTGVKILKLFLGHGVLKSTKREKSATYGNIKKRHRCKF
ncbi:hypothetical protein HDE70_001666 [Pedobacter cryoconitis]|nr:hypothetical protein [Pedobacter cryoconitis]